MTRTPVTSDKHTGTPQQGPSPFHDLEAYIALPRVGGLALSPDGKEQEANWLAGCLLLPRQLLYAAVRRGYGAADIADTYRVSEQMAAFRLRTTGVLRQLGAFRSAT